MPQQSRTSKRRSKLEALARKAFMEGFMCSSSQWNGDIADAHHLSDREISDKLEDAFCDWYEEDRRV